jgi:hypothetical protein
VSNARILGQLASLSRPTSASTFRLELIQEDGLPDTAKADQYQVLLGSPGAKLKEHLLEVGKLRIPAC